MKKEPIIQLSGVSKNYHLGKVKVTALKGVSIELFPQDFSVIAGPSGSGKTTLLNIIGLIDEPSSGKIFFEGEDITDRPLNNLYSIRRNTIGFIFQTFNLIPVLSLYENVEYPLILKGVSRKKRKEITNRILKRVGLYEHRGHKPDQLSGGQRQRVSIARAIVKNPALVIADEPTANLDSQTGVEIVELMKNLNGENGITFVFSSHDELIISEAKKVFHLRDGVIQK